REDAFARQVEAVSRIPDDAPYKRAMGAWLAVSFGACGFVGVRLARKLRRGEALEDSTREPPPWTVIDFTLVFILSLAGQQVIGAGVRPLVVLDDGRRFEIAAPVASVSFGTQVVVPGATGESAAIVHSGEDLVFRVPPVHDAAPPVFLNGQRLPPGIASERVLRRGDRFDVGGVRGVLQAPSNVEYLAAVGASSLVAPILVLIALRLRGARPRDLGLRGFTLRGAESCADDVLRGVVGYFAMVPGTFLATILSSLLCRAFGVSFHEHPLLRTLARENDGAALLMLLLVAAVIAPISEEVLFRGFLLRALRRPIPSRAGAILASSFFFAAFHPGLSSLLPILWVGSVFSLLFTSSKRGSLLPAIVCHALFNAVNILLQWGLVRST
ncbi:MAG: CPBP family glutamic-type intramembrane protease, partial [Planctomycetota bacterium]